jgi:hypothetical protein
MSHSTRYHYDRFSGCTQAAADNSALWALAQLHHSQGIYDPSCAVTGDEAAIYRAFYKTDLGGDIKAGIKARKALEAKRLVAA